MPDRIRLLSCVVLAFAVCLAIACKDEEKKAEPEVVVDGTGIGADATTTETTEMMGTDMGTDMSAQPTDMSVSTEMTVPTTEPPAASRGWFGSPGRPPAAPRTRRDDGASLDGDRLTFYATTTADQCEADCWADVRCAGWALIRQGFYAPTDPPMCYLLSRVTASTPSPCCISGIKVAVPVPSRPRIGADSRAAEGLAGRPSPPPIPRSSAAPSGACETNEGFFGCTGTFPVYYQFNCRFRLHYGKGEGTLTLRSDGTAELRLPQLGFNGTAKTSTGYNPLVGSADFGGPPVPNTARWDFSYGRNRGVDGRVIGPAGSGNLEVLDSSNDVACDSTECFCSGSFSFEPFRSP